LPSVVKPTSSQGYAHPGYAASLSGIGAPRELALSGGWILEREIPTTGLRDGTGSYPLFVCKDWARIADDLCSLAKHLVSVVLVADPLGAFTESDLRRSFDVVRPYKKHFVVDLTLSTESHMPRRHRRNIVRALERVQVEIVSNPIDMLDSWVELYGQLITRHQIGDFRTFSRETFAKQLKVPGLTLFKALADEEIVGLHWWFSCNDVAYGHLGATSARGYELMASYALYFHAIQHFKQRSHWLDLGGVPGLSDAREGSGLAQFKAGWATELRQAYVCGRILQPAAYARLAGTIGRDTLTFFPAYRAGDVS